MLYVSDPMPGGTSIPRPREPLFKASRKSSKAFAALCLLAFLSGGCSIRINRVVISGDGFASGAASDTTGSVPTGTPSASPSPTVALAISPTVLVMGQSQSATLKSTGGSGGSSFSIQGASLGSTIGAGSGVLTAGSTSGTITVRVTDSAGATSDATVTILQPTDNAGIVQWLRADALALADGAAVATWTDSTGTYNAAQGTASYRPVYKANIFGTKPSVRFDGVQTYLTSSAIPASGAGGRTVFTVIRNGSAATNSATANVWFWGGTSFYSQEYSLAFKSSISANPGSSNIGMDYYCSTTVLSRDCFASNVPSSTTAPLVITNSYDGTTDRIYINGVLAGSRTITLATATTSAFTLGYRGGAGTYFGGDVGEVISYNSALGTSARESIECYLSSKYSIPVRNSLGCGGSTLKLPVPATGTVVQASGTLTLAAAGGYPPYSYAVSSGGGTIGSSSGVFTAAASAGSSVVTVTDAAGATDTITLTTTAFPRPLTWFKPEGLTGYADGAPVYRWPDSSGSGYDASNYSSATSPVYKASILNSLPVVRFNGTSQFLVAGAIPATGANPRTLVAVIVNGTPTTTVNSTVVGYGDWGNWGTDWGIGFSLNSTTSSTGTSNLGISMNCNSSTRCMASSETPDAGARTVIAIYDGTAHSVYVNGVLKGTLTQGINTNGNGNIGLTLGALRLGASAWYQGDIAEVLSFSSALSATDRQALEAYLRAKYNHY